MRVHQLSLSMRVGAATSQLSPAILLARLQKLAGKLAVSEGDQPSLYRVLKISQEQQVQY